MERKSQPEKKKKGKNRKKKFNRLQNHEIKKTKKFFLLSIFSSLAGHYCQSHIQSEHRYYMTEHEVNISTSSSSSEATTDHLILLPHYISLLSATFPLVNSPTGHIQVYYPMACSGCTYALSIHVSNLYLSLHHTSSADKYVGPWSTGVTFNGITIKHKTVVKRGRNVANTKEKNNGTMTTEKTRMWKIATFKKQWKKS